MLRIALVLFLLNAFQRNVKLPENHCKCIEKRNNCGALCSKRRDKTQVKSSLKYSSSQSASHGCPMDVNVYPVYTNKNGILNTRINNRIPAKDTNIVVGVMAKIDLLAQRSLHAARLLALERTKHPNVKIIYVYCANDNSVQYYEELSTLKLNCSHGRENMNNGKSMDWFEYATSHFPSAQWIAKADLDTFIFSKNLHGILSCIPADRDVIYGFSCWGLQRLEICSPRQGKCGACGGFYAITSSLLNKIELNPVSGPEDSVMSKRALWDVPSSIFAQDHYNYRDMHHNGYETSTQPFGFNPYTAVIHAVKTKLQWDSINEWLFLSNNGTQRCTSDVIWG